jgi:ParB/RepB/Spo0J family partition protein
VEEQVQSIPLRCLRPPRVLLRPVNKRSVAFLEMKGTIQRFGLWNSIAVRPTEMPGVYEIIDGYYRFTCCELLNWEAIPCIIKHGLTDEDVLAAQVQANAIRPETKPVEFARQLKRLQTARPDITLSEMAAMVGKTTKWIKQQLSLLTLIEPAQKLVDRDEMPLLNAYMLAKIPLKIQPEFLDRAQELPPAMFKAAAAAVIRQVMEAIKTGKLENWFVKPFKPQPFQKPLKDVLKELESGQVGTKTVLKAGLKTPLEGWKKALEWVASLDAETLEQQQKKTTKRQQRQTLERTTYLNKIDDAVPDPDSSSSDSH